MERMQVEAEALGAEGIVGVTLTESNHSWGSHVLEFFAVGTAVTPMSEDHHIAAPALVLNLNDAGSRGRLTGFRPYRAGIASRWRTRIRRVASCGARFGFGEVLNSRRYWPPGTGRNGNARWSVRVKFPHGPARTPRRSACTSVRPRM